MTKYELLHQIKARGGTAYISWSKAKLIIEWMKAVTLKQSLNAGASTSATNGRAAGNRTEPG